MNTRKRILTPTEQIHNLLGMYDLKPEDQELDYYSQNQEDYQPVRKRLSTKAVLWSLFNNGNATHYFCTLCPDNKQAFKKPASSTVATRHVRRFHLDHPRVQELLQINPDFLQSNGTGGNTNAEHSPIATSTAHFDIHPLQIPRHPSVEVKKPKQIQFEACLAKLLSLPNMPIQLAVSAEMLDLFQCLDPKIPLSTNVDQLKDILDEQAIQIRQTLNGELAAFKGSLSATIGVWRIEEPFGLFSTYITVMVQFTSDDRLQHRFLGAQKLEPNENVAHTYRKILEEYELDLADIYRTCVNGTSTIVDSFVNYGKFQHEVASTPAIKSRLNSPEHPTDQKSKPLETVQLDSGIFEQTSSYDHINEVVQALNDAQCHPCIAHDLKLTLFNTIRTTLVQSTTFQRMLGLFHLFQNNPDAMASLSETVGQLFVPIDQTEWSSWICAVEYYCQHRHLLAQIAIQHNWEQLTDEENELLKGYLNVISVFRSSIKTLESTGTPTVSWVYGIFRAINEKLNTGSKNPQVQQMCKTAIEQMQKLAYVQEDPIFVISTFLDPATKRHLKQADAEKAIELIADWLKVEDVELLSQQEEKYSSADDPLLQMLDSFAPSQNDLTSFVRSFVELVQAEFQRQPEKGKYSSTTLRILQNAGSDARYEGIIKIARVVLGVPTSNVGLESDFVRKHHHCQTKENDVLDVKLRIYFNNQNHKSI